MKQQGQSGVRKNIKDTVSGQQTRRSMIVREENPPAINEPNIQGILALQLSDTLINAAYSLTATKIALAIQKFTNPLESLFVSVKLVTFQRIRIHANSFEIAKGKLQEKTTSKNVFQSRQSIMTHIDMLKEESVIKEEKNFMILLTKQLQIEKVQNTIVAQLKRMVRILEKKHTKTKYESLLKIQAQSTHLSATKPHPKTSIQQTFQKYQQSRQNIRHFHRRSIDKQPQRKSSNQLSYSLNKQHDYQFSGIKSPQRNTKNKNLLYTYAANNTDKKASTCSQTQSNHSQKEVENLSHDYYYTETGKTSQGSSITNRLKIPATAKNLPSGTLNANDSRVSSSLLNGSYFAEGTKERELQILRKKYFRLVEEFKDFSERFLQVIKEE